MQLVQAIACVFATNKEHYHPPSPPKEGIPCTLSCWISISFSARMRRFFSLHVCVWVLRGMAVVVRWLATGTGGQFFGMTRAANDLLAMDFAGGACPQFFFFLLRAATRTHLLPNISCTNGSLLIVLVHRSHQPARS